MVVASELLVPTVEKLESFTGGRQIYGIFHAPAFPLLLTCLFHSCRHESIDNKVSESNCRLLRKKLFISNVCLFFRLER